jgi:hypothetical protein
MRSSSYDHTTDPNSAIPSYNSLFLSLIIRDREMSHRGSTIMSDVFRKTVKIFNIISEIPYLPVTG